MRDIRCELFTCLMLAAVQLPLTAQPAKTVPASAPLPSPATDNHSVEMEQKLEAISSPLATTSQQLQQSQLEIQQLREELVQIKKQLASIHSVPGELPHS